MSNANDLAVISCFYSYTNNEYLESCYHRFAEKLKEQGVPLFVAFLRYGKAISSTPNNIYKGDHGETILELNSPHVLWHKEVLLNKAEKIVPEQYTKIAWLDCDVLIQNDDWAEGASSLLNDNYALQVGETFKFLGADSNLEKTQTSIACAVENGISKFNLKDYHSGLGWAANRSFFRDVGLYEYGVIGGGDSAMAEGWLNRGKPSSWKIRFLGSKSKFLLTKLQEYTQEAHKKLTGKISYLKNDVIHMYHSPYGKRAYVERFNTVDGLVEGDIKKDESGLWAWQNPSYELEIKKYFEERDDITEAKKNKKIKIVHFYNDFPPEEAEQKRRHDHAKRNWKEILYAKQNDVEISPLPINTNQLFRDSSSINGSRKLPFLRDIFNHAISQNPGCDFFLFSNNDICFVEDPVPQWIINVHFKERNTKEMAVSYRPRQIPFNLTKLKSEEGKWPNKRNISIFPSRDHGFDAFLFHKDWWENIHKIFPDFIIGHSRWDVCMNYFCAKCAPMEHWKIEYTDLCYHETHSSFWRSRRGMKCTEEVHNVKEFNKLKEIIYKISNLGS